MRRRVRLGCAGASVARLRLSDGLRHVIRNGHYMYMYGTTRLPDLAPAGTPLPLRSAKPLPRRAPPSHVCPGCG